MHSRFNYKTQEEFHAAVERLGLEMPWSDELDILSSSWKLANQELSNRFVIHPMEGFDAKLDGRPSGLTLRRYERFATGGSSLIWVEATSVNKSGKSNPHQLHLHKSNFNEFRPIVEKLENNGAKSIIQLTHSGRYAKPEGRPQPQVLIPSLKGEDPLCNQNLLTDADLNWIRDDFVEAAMLAEKVGFDGIDLKMCHGYLLHELLFSFDREGSLYGGKEWEKRVLLIEEILQGIRQTTSLLLTLRINVFDGLEGGFGMDHENPKKENLSEPLKLIERFEDLDVALLSITAGVPYRNPWMGRPFDRPVKNAPDAPEHPMLGAKRLINLTAEIKKHTKVPIVGAGLSWLRHYFPEVAAGIIREDLATAVGMGRLAFAYPDMASDIAQTGKANPKKCCVACSGCTARMRQGKTAGCIIRDREFYA